uniref:Uncharacterized protein n=1 Tax=Parastrongyloides trichosuri TaxID=131310 RepID=A0A0N4ZD49_PARTI
MIKGRIRPGINYIGSHCYGVEYTMVVTGELFCNGTRYNNSKIAIKECDESGTACDCYCEEYKVYLTGNIYCRSNPYTRATIDIYLCSLPRLSCTKISHTNKVGLTLFYSGYLSNERKSDSTLRIDINHNCCGQIRGIKFYPNTKILYPFENYLKCGNEWNFKDLGQIELSDNHCSSKDFVGPFGKK